MFRVASHGPRKRTIPAVSSFHAVDAVQSPARFWRRAVVAMAGPQPRRQTGRMAKSAWDWLVLVAVAALKAVARYGRAATAALSKSTTSTAVLMSADLPESQTPC